MSSDVLRAASTEARVAWLAAASERLRTDIERGPEALAEATGLSAPMVEWGARTTLETMHVNALQGLANEAGEAGGDPISSLSVVLAGNLFTAAARAIVVPLLLGIPVVAKASSRETLFPEMLQRALRATDPELGSAMNLVVFPGGDDARERALIEASEATAVYGGDDTIEAIRRRHPNVRLIPHGHGVSVAYCGPAALGDDQVEETIAAVALDICAYDQRGCLSPQVIYVTETSACSVATFAERLAADGLRPLGNALPRGPLPLEVGAAQAQWRGVAEVEGKLIAGNGFAIAVRASEPIRWSPGYRNVTVAPVRNAAEAVAAMAPLGATLKCIGVDERSSAELTRELERVPGLVAYPCPLGSMQTPPLDAPADARPVWHGLIR